MATKQETMNAAIEGKGCLGKAEPDEPVFVLKASDELATDKVIRWAAEAGKVLGFDHPKVREAFDCAEAMRKWPVKKFPD